MADKRKIRRFKAAAREIGRYVILILAVFSLAVLTLLGYSLAEMQLTSTKTTTNYVLNLTRQLTNMVDLEIGSGRQQLTSIGDSFEQVVSKEDDAGVEEFLTRKQAICGFDFIALEDTQKNRIVVAGVFPEDRVRSIEALRNMDTSRRAQESGSCKMGIENENVIYAMPLYAYDKQIGFIWAGNTAESMQDMIRSRSFQGRAYSCIINNLSLIHISEPTRH